MSKQKLKPTCKPGDYHIFWYDHTPVGATHAIGDDGIGMCSLKFGAHPTDPPWKKVPHGI